MRTISLGSSDLRVPVVAVGCMRLCHLDKPAAERFVSEALELGANFFDHADIYGAGACEERFAEAAHLSPSRRETVILQSKCGIRPGAYDFSRLGFRMSNSGGVRNLRSDRK